MVRRYDAQDFGITAIPSNQEEAAESGGQVRT